MTPRMTMPHPEDPKTPLISAAPKPPLVIKWISPAERQERLSSCIAKRSIFYQEIDSHLLLIFYQGWLLHSHCGIHILLMNNGLAIHMLTEKKYPLSQEMLSKMLSTRLEVDHESSQAFELLRFIRAQVQK
ncbi:hypothetical protein Tco_0637393 [Tanacetum coccineum]